MKKLILLPIFSLLSSLVFANPVPEIMGPQKNEMLTRIKDMEIGQNLKTTAQFRDCYEPYKLTPGEDFDPAKHQARLDAAQKCFKDKLSQVKDKTQLEEFGQELKLQPFGLVPSNSVSEIQKYLQGKMTEALTGIRPETLAAIQDKKQYAKMLREKKNVDQVVFLKLHNAQLGKNAMLEISKFCFERFRNVPSKSTNTSFWEHWKNHTNLVQDSKAVEQNIASLTDLGDGGFGSVNDNEQSKDEMYKKIFEGISGGQQPNPQFLANFFQSCGTAMNLLCDGFKKSITNQDMAKSQVDVGAGKGPIKPGAAACRTLTRLAEYKEAITKTKEVIEQMNKDEASGGIALAKMKNFGAPGDPSIDDLTSNASTAFLEGGQKDPARKKKEEECEQRPELDNCKDLYMSQEELEKIKMNTEYQMTLKREVEMKRVQEIVAANKKDLDKYLEENGMYDILKKWKDGTLTEAGVSEEVGKFFEAQKIATMNEMNQTLGKRQVKKDGSNISNASNAAKASKEERSRLAQVVLFNNIITSHLELTKDDGKGGRTSAGRNVNAWKREEQALNSKSVSSQYFEHLKAKDSGNTLSQQDADKIESIELINSFLGKPKNP